MTDCTSRQFEFQAPGRRRMVAQFDGGAIVSDGGAPLLYEVEERLGIVGRLASCFEDHRDPDRVEHTVDELLRQRVFALALGYEDLVDHDELRRDPLLATLSGKTNSLSHKRFPAQGVELILGTIAM